MNLLMNYSYNVCIIIIGGGDNQDPGPQSFIFNSSRSNYTFKIINENKFEVTDQFQDQTLLQAVLRSNTTRVALNPAQANITVTLEDDGKNRQLLLEGARA